MTFGSRCNTLLGQIATGFMRSPRSVPENIRFARNDADMRAECLIKLEMPRIPRKSRLALDKLSKNSIFDFLLEGRFQELFWMMRTSHWKTRKCRRFALLITVEDWLRKNKLRRFSPTT